MGWQDRVYSSPDDHEHGGGMPRFSVTAWLVIINVVVFLIDSVFFGSRNAHALAPAHWFAFDVSRGILGLQIWRLVTYQFVHHDFFHILFNMIMLWVFGRWMEQWWGSRRFLAFYLVSGIAAAVAYVVIAVTIGPALNVNPGSLVGASGSVFGVLVGAAVKFPRMRIQLLFPPIPMTVRTLALIALGLAALKVLAGSVNAGGEVAHLGGALMGFVLIKYPPFLAWAEGGTARKIQRAYQQSREQQQTRLSRRETEELDRVLDKVRDRGLHSLTPRERRILQRETDKRKRV